MSFTKTYGGLGLNRRGRKRKIKNQKRPIQCQSCGEEIEYGEIHPILTGQGISKKGKKFWFTSRRHLKCFIGWLIEQVDAFGEKEQEHNSQRVKAGRRPTLTQLSEEEKIQRKKLQKRRSYLANRLLTQELIPESEAELMEEIKEITTQIKEIAPFSGVRTNKRKALESRYLERKKNNV